MKAFLLKYRQVGILCCHIGIVTLSMLTAFLLRFDFSVSRADIDLLRTGVALAVIIKVPVFFLAKLHRGWWQYVGIADIYSVLRANIAASTLFVPGVYLLVGPSFPRSIYIIDFLLCFLMTGGLRFAVRIYNELFTAEMPTSKSKGILIYGAGLAGTTLVREIHVNRELNYKIIGFLDDERPQIGSCDHGCVSLGQRTGCRDGRGSLQAPFDQGRRDRHCHALGNGPPDAGGHGELSGCGRFVQDDSWAD